MEIFLSLITILIFLIIIFVKRKLKYWQNLGVEHEETVFLLGNMQNIVTRKETLCEHGRNVYNKFKAKGLPYGGEYILLMPMFFPVDPNLIKHIIQNDFLHFMDRGVYSNEKTDPLSANIFMLEGTKWKNLRAKLTPTFTTGKMKMMLPMVVECGKQLQTQMDKDIGKTIDIKDVLTRFTTDIIASCSFGIECNSLKDPQNEFSLYCKNFFHRTNYENFIQMLTFTVPEICRFFNARQFKPKMTNFFYNVIKETVEYRERNNIKRDDFMDLLLQLKNNNDSKDEGGDNEETSITFTELAAQAFIFFVAGFETSSTTMTFCLFELAFNADIQKKLRQEIVQVLKKHEGKITYEALMDMNYMDKVIAETLRKYPPLPTLYRICTKDYRVPHSDLVIEKGTKVSIPVYGLHHDPEYYPDPEKFDPERFSEENKLRPQCTYLPFGDGPRICIGDRFGKMQTKVGLCVLIKNYRFTVSSSTKLPLKMDPETFILTTQGGIWLDYEKISD